MSRSLCVFVLLLLAAGILLGGWVYTHRQTLSWQWDSYRVGAAASYEDARKKIAHFEQGHDAPERLRVLVSKWGAGNPRFDLYLAQYAAAGESSSALRGAFSRELGRRPEVLPRWAHFWSWQAPIEPDRHIASIVDYLDALAFDSDPAADPTLTWREVLDLQAVFTLSGDPNRAARLTPENWRDYYRVWREGRHDAVQHVPRPADPLPD